MRAAIQREWTNHELIYIQKIVDALWNNKKQPLAIMQLARVANVPYANSSKSSGRKKAIEKVQDLMPGVVKSFALTHPGYAAAKRMDGLTYVTYDPDFAVQVAYPRLASDFTKLERVIYEMEPVRHHGTNAAQHLILANATAARDCLLNAKQAYIQEAKRIKALKEGK